VAAIDNLIPGETIVVESRKHWIAPVRDSIWAALLIVGAFVVGWISPSKEGGLVGVVSNVLDLLRIGLFAVGVGWIIYNVVAWRSAQYTVTNRRLMGQEGLARKRETDSLLSSISDVRMRQSAVGRMMGYGDLQIMSASGEAGADRFTTVIGAVELKKHILEQKVAESQAAATPAPTVAASAAAAAPTTSAPSPAQAEAIATINSLAALRDSGAITADEFEAKKKELLSRI